MKKNVKKMTALLLAGAVSAAAFSVTVSADWEPYSEARWKYSYADGSYASGGFVPIDGQWYLFSEDGVMQTGWHLIDGSWYLMPGSGERLTGWQKNGGCWYYFDANGVMQSGWQQIDGSWYYLGEDGRMQTGWKLIGGSWYYLGGGGAMKTGWLQQGSKWYFLNGGGVMQTGWVYTGGAWYYMDGNGVMQTGSLTIGGISYTFSSSGALQNGTPPVSADADLSGAKTLLNAQNLYPQTTTDSSLNKLVSDWTAGNLTRSMDTFTQVKTVYDYLLDKAAYGVSDKTIVDTTGMTMDQLMDLYFGGPEYNARVLLQTGKGTEEHFAAALAALLRSVGLDCEVTEGIVYQDASLSTGKSSSWVTVTLNGQAYIFDPVADRQSGSRYAHFCKTASELGGRYQANDTFAFRS